MDNAGLEPSTVLQVNGRTPGLILQFPSVTKARPLPYLSTQKYPEADRNHAQNFMRRRIDSFTKWPSA